METKQKRKQQILGMLTLCVCGAAVYELPYLSWSYYDAVLEYFNVNNTQMGTLMSIFGITCVISYLPSGWLADQFDANKLIAISLASTSTIGVIVTLFPSYNILIFCYAFYGITCTVPLWSSMMKATRELGDPSEMGRLYGFLEGGRGLLPVIYGAFIIPIFGMLGEGANGFKAVLWYFIILGYLCSILAFTCVKKLREDEEDSIKNESLKHTFKDYLDMLKNKRLWLLTLLMFCCFMVYESYSYVTPYLTNFFGISESLGAAISLIKSYGLAVFGGIIAGFIADKIHSNPKVIFCGFTIMGIALATFLFIPANPDMIAIAAISILILSLGLFMIRALYFAVIDEIKIPLKYTGMAVGFASVIGCLPQIFIYSITGNLLDTFPGIEGYKYMFIYMLCSSMIGAIATLILYRIIKKDNKKSIEGISSERK